MPVLPKQFRSYHMLCFVVPALAILVLDLAGVLVFVGAHPFWSLRGAAIGMALGLLVLLGITYLTRFGRISELLLTLIFAILALVAGILMLNGKESFAMSYASDVVAGRFWYFGYIGFIAAFYAALVCACRAFMARRLDL